MSSIFLYLTLCLLSTTNAFILRNKENIILIPTAAFRDHSKVPSTDWLLYNKGWYYEENNVQAKILEKSLELVIKKDLDGNRVKLFTAEGAGNRDLCVDGLNRSMCTKTDDEGRIKNTFQLTDAELKRFIQPEGNTAKLFYQVSVPNRNIRATGKLFKHTK